MKRLSRARTFAAWTSIGHPSITEIFAASGVDFVGIDLEHSTINLEQAQRIIAAAHAGGVSCLPRVASHNGEQIKRLLDSGADGIIVPMVSTVSQVRQIVDWCKYTPVGKRSYGVARAQGYGFDFARYTSHEAIDGVMIGPYDLSGSLGIPGQLFHPRVTEACRSVVEACERHGKACGTQIVEASPEALSAAFAAGYTFVVLSSDVFLLWKWSERVKDMLASLR
jgi:2-dehydro-3-deoxyglucarate aldolase